MFSDTTCLSLPCIGGLTRCSDVYDCVPHHTDNMVRNADRPIIYECAMVQETEDLEPNILLASPIVAKTGAESH